MRQITDEYWESLEISARSAVVAGGISAMGYYRSALGIATVLEQNLSPSTLADTQATLAILRSLSPSIAFIAGKLALGFSFFAEELEKKETSDSSADLREANIKKILDQVGGIAANIKRSATEFQESFENCIAVLFDALDGTTNFRAGIPFFCSAVAFFIRGKPRVGAIYDPHHNVVYYGSLRDTDIGDIRATAYAWQVQSGNRINLTDLKGVEKPGRLIALHLTRTKKEKREELIKKLNSLTINAEGTYMLNSGQLVLAYIASGNLSAFVNNYTNIWDVGAGDVLVQAIGGKVTDFKDNPIDYGKGTKIAVVASSNQALHSEIRRILAE